MDVKILNSSDFSSVRDWPNHHQPSADDSANHSLVYLYNFQPDEPTGSSGSAENHPASGSPLVPLGVFARLRMLPTDLATPNLLARQHPSVYLAGLKIS